MTSDQRIKVFCGLAAHHLNEYSVECCCKTQDDLRTSAGVLLDFSIQGVVKILGPEKAEAWLREIADEISIRKEECSNVTIAETSIQ